MKLKNGWRYLSVEELEKHNYGDPEKAPTALLARCWRYVKIPVDILSVEQLRTLISQHIGLDYLVPLALEILSEDILAEGDLYEGDLVNAVYNIKPTFWNENQSLSIQFNNLIKQHSDELKHVLKLL